MLAVLLLLGALQGAPAPDSTFATPALDSLVRRVIATNRVVPRDIAGFRTTVETETAFVLNEPAPRGGGVSGTRGGSRDVAGQVEQFSSVLSWRRDGRVDQRVVGYRSQSAGAALSVRTFIPQSWLLPTLYGDTLPLFVKDSVDPARGSTRGIIHPFGEAGPQFYRYTAGDTTLAASIGPQRVVLVHVHVEPRPDVEERVRLFTGDAVVDQVSGQVVRLRGRLVSPASRPKGLLRALQAVTGLQLLGFIEMENQLVDQFYWLPTYQRIELQIASKLNDSRGSIRFVSRYGEYEVEEQDSAVVADADVVNGPRLTFASGDSVSSFGNWNRPLGALTQQTDAGEFDDIAPSWRRPTGPPYLGFQARDFIDLFRFNKVEGVFTGASGIVRLRDALPGGLIRGNIGYAWNQQTVRGSLDLALERRDWVFNVRVARDLLTTNTYGTQFDAASSILQAFGQDNFNFVDRWSATVGVGHPFGRNALSQIRLETGWMRDQFAPNTVDRSPFGADTYRPAAPVLEGSYLGTMLYADYNRNVTGRSLQNGVGGFFVYERGDMGVIFQRARLRISSRSTVGRFFLISRVEGGILAADDVPAQRVFRVGGIDGLPGYDFQQFAGDRAVVGRVALQYNLPFLAQPIRVSGLALPGVQPALAVGLYGAWTDASRSARPLFNALGWQTTDGLRSVLDIRLKIFGGGLTAGVSRRLQESDRWRFSLSVGGDF